MKPVLFVDIDGVVADSIVRWIELHNRKYGTRFTIHDVYDYDLEKCLGYSLEEFYTDYDGVQPVLLAGRCITELSRYYRIVYATAGFGSRWLISQPFYNQNEIIQIRDKSLLLGYALIDDYPLNLDVFQGERYLLSQPWNTGRGLNDSTWEQITKHLVEVAHERISVAD